jgi:hypothetical protein
MDFGWVNAYYNGQKIAWYESISTQFLMLDPHLQNEFVSDFFFNNYMLYTLDNAFI